MKGALEELGINLQDTDIFITHYHGDHFGLVHRLMSAGISVYMSEIDAGTVAKIGTGAIMAEIVNFIRMSGIPEDEAKEMVPPDATRPFRADYSLVFKFLKDNDFLEVGITGSDASQSRATQKDRSASMNQSAKFSFREIIFSAI